MWQHDVLIPEKYGISINIGDTRGPSGIFRMLRTLPTMLVICRDMEDLCAGAILLNYTNPMAWYTKLEHRGRDLYPKLKRLVSSDKEIYEEEVVRNEMFLALGAYVTESSGHNSEYNWWFRKRPDLIRQYCRGTGSNPGRHLHALKAYRRREKTWKREIREGMKDYQPARRRYRCCPTMQTSSTRGRRSCLEAARKTPSPSSISI